MYAPADRRSPARKCDSDCERQPAADAPAFPPRGGESVCGCADEFRSYRLEPLLASRAGLAGLLAQYFAGITDALILIRIRRPQGANVRRYLPHRLPVKARYNHMGKLVDLDIHSSRHHHFDGMRITEREGRDLA